MDQLHELRPVRYAQIPHEALDGLPDLNSIGLLAIMLRHRADYPFKVGDVIRQKKPIPGPKLGERVAYGAMTTLIQHRWAARVKYMCARGHMHTAVWRTAQRLTDDDLRTIAEKYTAGTERILHCKGCSTDPEIPVRTVIRAGATLQGPWGDYVPIADLLAPGGALGGAAPAPVPENAGTGATSENTTSPQVAPDPANPGTGRPGTGNPGTFKNNSENNSPPLPHEPPAPREDEEDSTPEPKTPAPNTAAGIVAKVTGATPDEAQAVVERLAAAAEERAAKKQGRPVGALARYVRGCATEDLDRHLAAVRRAAAPPPREAGHDRAEVRCVLHRLSASVAKPCGGCVDELELDPVVGRDVLADLLAEAGADQRPDLVALLDSAEDSTAAEVA